MAAWLSALNQQPHTTVYVCPSGILISFFESPKSVDMNNEPAINPCIICLISTEMLSVMATIVSSVVAFLIYSAISKARSAVPACSTKNLAAFMLNLTYLPGQL